MCLASEGLQSGLYKPAVDSLKYIKGSQSSPYCDKSDVLSRPNGNAACVRTSWTCASPEPCENMKQWTEMLQQVLKLYLLLYRNRWSLHREQCKESMYGTDKILTHADVMHCTLRKSLQVSYRSLALQCG